MFIAQMYVCTCVQLKKDKPPPQKKQNINKLIKSEKYDGIRPYHSFMSNSSFRLLHILMDFIRQALIA